jgi:hypothetical protein
MKTIVLFFCLSSLCLTGRVRADECCEANPASIEQRIRDIDLKIALQQYEEIQTAKAKTQVQLMLLSADVGESSEHDKQSGMLRKRVQILQSNAEEIRIRMLELSKAIAVAGK